MTHPSLRLVAARYVLELTETPAVIQAAHDALDDGIYAHGLGEIITARDVSWGNIAPFLLSALRELGIPLPDKEEAAVTVVAEYVRPIAEGGLAPDAGVRSLYSDCYAALAGERWVTDGGPLLQAAEELCRYEYLFDEWTYYQPGPRDEAESDANLIRLKAEVVEVARQWCRDHGRAVVKPEWMTSTVTSLAEGIADASLFDRLPILADALEEAGCDDIGMLHHLRGGTPHVHVCWVVDLLLTRS
jgi:hypothetical protein